MKNGINESPSEFSNSQHGAHKKRKIDALTKDTDKSSQHLQSDLVEAQQKIAKLEEANKQYQIRLQNEFITTCIVQPASLSTYLSNLQAVGLLHEIDWNCVNPKAPYEGMTALQILVEIACNSTGLLTYLEKNLFREDQLKSFDFNVSGAHGSAFYILLTQQMHQQDVSQGRAKSLQNDHLHLRRAVQIGGLIKTIEKMTPLENVKINNTSERSHSVIKFLLYSTFKNDAYQPTINFIERILNEIPLHVDLDRELVQMFSATKWSPHVNFILKLQKINQALGEPDEIENAEEPQKSVEQLMVEAEALAKTAEENGYTSAYYWLSKVLQSEFYHHYPTMEYLDQWRRMAKKIPKNHPEYIDIHRTLADEYQLFLTDLEHELRTVPKANRSTVQQAEIEALQRPKLLTALRAAGRIKDNDPVAKELYNRLGYMLVQGIDEVGVTQNLEFEAMLDKLSSSSKKESVLFLGPSLALENSNAAMSTEKATGEQEVTESSTQLGFGFSSSRE